MQVFLTHRTAFACASRNHLLNLIYNFNHIAMAFQHSHKTFCEKYKYLIINARFSHQQNSFCLCIQRHNHSGNHSLHLYNFHHSGKAVQYSHQCLSYKKRYVDRQMQNCNNEPTADFSNSSKIKITFVNPTKNSYKTKKSLHKERTSNED